MTRKQGPETGIMLWISWRIARSVREYVDLRWNAVNSSTRF
jgi:hypothetical protein